MYDLPLFSHLADFALGLLAVITLAAVLLRWRDRKAFSEGKTPQQIQARTAAILAFQSALKRCIPGVLVMIFGAYFSVVWLRQHNSDWWQGLVLIPLGWFLVPLLARKKWLRYRALQQLSEMNPQEANPRTTPL